MNESITYEQLKTIIKGLIKRDSNFRKSPAHPFQLEFLLDSRNNTVKNKIEGLRLAKALSKTWKSKEDDEKVQSKINLINTFSSHILCFIRTRVGRVKVWIDNFTLFLEFLKRDGMAEFKYGDAKHLPELKEIKKSTAIRDF